METIRNPYYMISYFYIAYKFYIVSYIVIYKCFSYGFIIDNNTEVRRWRRRGWGMRERRRWWSIWRCLRRGRRS